MEQLRDAVRELRLPRRAVTCRDFEQLALAADPETSLDQDREIQRAHCFAGVNLDATPDGVPQTGHVSIVIVPPPRGRETDPSPTPAMLERVHHKLDTYRLLATRLHVVGPRYIRVHLKVTIVVSATAQEWKVKDNVRKALERFLDAVGRHPDEPEYEGWAFGRSVFSTEIYALIERQYGVEYVAGLELSCDEPDRFLRNESGETVGIELRRHELPVLHIDDLITRFPMSESGAVN